MGSNPTPRTRSSTHRSEPRHIQEIEPKALSAIIELAFWMQRTGYRKSTITTCARTLRALARKTNLMNPETVKAYIGSAELSENRKTKLIEDATRFYKYHRIPFNRPRYQRIETIPFIPLEITILWFAIAATVAFFFRTSRSAGLILLPYLGWVSLAAYLNYMIFILNT